VLEACTLKYRKEENKRQKDAERKRKVKEATTRLMKNG
jgi:hypothetical protein